MTFVETGVGTNLWTRAADVPVYGEWCVGSDNKAIYYQSFCTSKMIHQSNTWNTCLSEEEHFIIIDRPGRKYCNKSVFVTTKILRRRCVLIPPRTPFPPSTRACYAAFTWFDLISYIMLEFNRPRGNSHDRSSTMD